MHADYLDVLRKRNLLTWGAALVAAILMNSAIFIIMPMLQTCDESDKVPLEVVPDVQIAPAMPLKKELMKQKQPRASSEKVIDIPKFPAPKLPALRPAPVQLPSMPDVALMPAIKEPSSLPVDFGFEGSIKPQGIFSAGDLDAPVAVEARVPPVYPLRARQRRIEGWVRVRLLVDAAGRVEKAEIVEAEPPGYFEKSVLECVRKWKLSPPTVGGEPVKAWMVTRIRFRLE